MLSRNKVTTTPIRSIRSDGAAAPRTSGLFSLFSSPRPGVTGEEVGLEAILDSRGSPPLRTNYECAVRLLRWLLLREGGGAVNQIG